VHIFIARIASNRRLDRFQEIFLYAGIIILAHDVALYRTHMCVTLLRVHVQQIICILLTTRVSSSAMDTFTVLTHTFSRAVNQFTKQRLSIPI